MEVPDVEHGRISHGTHKPGAVPGDEPRWGDHCDWGWGRDAPVLECIPEEGEERAGEGESVGLRAVDSVGWTG